jgi:glycosyltransferase involved in cell wall biosynthesis
MNVTSKRTARAAAASASAAVKSAVAADALADARVAVLVPCYNEEVAIAEVVASFQKALPDAVVYVYDNNSKDGTVAAAKKAGAVVGNETRQGKGHVVRRMFADIDADIYLLVDGDATYDAPSAPKMIGRLVSENLDMVVGTRADREEAAYRRGHRSGNAVFTWFVAGIFGSSFTDILSGYRVFSRRFVKSFPALSTGFEIETELTIHALELGMPVGEVVTPYFSRPEGSASKLNTYRDGMRISWMIQRLFRTERPLQFFGLLSFALLVISIALAFPIVRTYIETGLVPRLPTAILATGMMLAAFLALASGLVLDTVTRGRREMKRLAYLAHRAPSSILEKQG